MPDPPKTVAQYLKSLPDDRREAIEAVRKVIRANLDTGYREGLQYGMIGYYVPHSVYPAGYHCDPKQPLPYLSIASQKNYMAIYLFCIYTSEEEQERFRDAWLKTGRKLDMGKSCVRFRKIEDVALDVLGRTVKRTPVKKFIAFYEKQLEAAASRKRGGRKPSATTDAKNGATTSSTAPTTSGTTRKPTAKKPVAAKSAAKKSSAKKPTAKKSSGRRRSG